MKTILLTGGTGFLGSHLLKALIENSYKVIILKRSFSNIERIKNEINNNFVSYLDVDKEDIEKVFVENSIDIIIHCATEYGRNNISCAKVLESNLIYPIKLLELGVKYNVSAFINTDSYFNKDELSYNYLFNYSLSKKSLNLWLKYFSKKIKVINLVLEHIYGENDCSHKFVENMIEKIAIEQVPEIDLTNGEQKRDFIYIKDVVDIYIAAINYAYKHKFRFRNFDVGTGKMISIKEFVSNIQKISRSSTKLNFGKIPYREDEIFSSQADICELEELINPELFTTPKEGISSIINIYKEMKYVNKR